MKIFNTLCVFFLLVTMTSCFNENDYSRDRPDARTCVVEVRHPGTNELLPGIVGSITITEIVDYGEGGTGETYNIHEFETSQVGLFVLPNPIDVIDGLSVTFNGNDGYWNKTYPLEKESSLNTSKSEYRITLYIYPEAIVQVNYDNVKEEYKGVKIGSNDTTVWGFDAKGTMYFVEVGEKDFDLTYVKYVKDEFQTRTETGTITTFLHSADTNIITLDY